MKRIAPLLCLLVLIALPTIALAQAAEAPPAPTGGPAWLDTVIKSVFGLLAMLATAFIIPYIKSKAEAAKAEREKLETEAVTNELSARALLVAQLKEFLLTEAAQIAEERFPDLCRKVAAKGLDLEAIKVEMRKWGTQLRQDATQYFHAQGYDIVKALGEGAIESLVKWAADAVSPFPGKETTAALIDGGAKMVLDKGIDWCRGQTLYFDTGDGSDGSATVAEVEDDG